MSDELKASQAKLVVIAKDILTRLDADTIKELGLSPISPEEQAELRTIDASDPVLFRLCLMISEAKLASKSLILRGKLIVPDYVVGRMAKYGKVSFEVAKKVWGSV